MPRSTTSTASPVAFAPPLIGSDEIAEVIASLESGWLTTGPRVAAFERAFAEYADAAHAVALNSCTAALHLSLLAAGVEAGDEVVTTPLTFCATANTIIHAGARPVFADVDIDTGNLDPSAAAAAFTSRTRALLPVHFAGRPVDVVGCHDLARRYSVPVIEDAAHCVEVIADGHKVGSTADFTCFSFYATMNLTTGEGGMVTTNDSRAAAFIRTASLHGLHQLAHLEERLARRETIWNTYDRALATLPLRLPRPTLDGDRHARHLYTVLVDERAAGMSRDALQQRLAERGVATSIHFRALHLHPYYQERFGYTRGMFPAAEAISDSTLSLPLSAAMTPETVDCVIEAVHDSFL